MNFDFRWICLPRVIVAGMLLLLFPEVRAAESAFRPEVLLQMESAILKQVASTNLPGGVLWVEHGGSSFHKAFGRRSVWPVTEAMTEDTIFDAASLTKVLATTPSLMCLVESGQVSLDDPIEHYFPEFLAARSNHITLRLMLTHTSGLPPGIELASHWAGYEAGIEKACGVKLATVPGTKFTYSDVNFILLGELVRRVSGYSLDEYSRRRIYQPLGMADTGFRPSSELRGRVAPTERVGDSVFRGVVHDPTSRAMGGIAGHAGLFTTASDVARFCRMMLQKGSLDGHVLFKPATVDLMTGVQTPPGVTARRGLGWDIDSPYAGLRGAHFPLGSYGHTGWTGTSLWIDPYSQTFVVFLSNRNHPSEEGTTGGLRSQLSTLAAEALTDVDFSRFTNALPVLPQNPVLQPARVRRSN
jgi:CubicO group peptidase (beta-lactamase class C family)